MSYFADIEAIVQPPIDPSYADYGIGIVGAGRIVDEKHCPAYRQAGLRIIGITDLRHEQAEKVAAHHDIPKVYSSLQAMLDDPAIAIVDCAIPNDGRRDIIRAVAAAGKHLLVHKPFATDYGEGRAFVAIAEEHGVHIAESECALGADLWRRDAPVGIRGHRPAVLAASPTFIRL